MQHSYLEQPLHTDSHGAMKMNTNFTEGSATIYEFPTRVGGTVGARPHDETSAAGDFESPRFGSGWYHDAAVGAEEQTPRWRSYAGIWVTRRSGGVV